MKFLETFCVLTVLMLAVCVFFAFSNTPNYSDAVSVFKMEGLSGE